MTDLLKLILGVLASLFRSRAKLEAENLVLRQQIKQWGVYQNNPLVVNKGMSIKEAKGLDKFEKGGCLIDGKRVWEFPTSP